MFISGFSGRSGKSWSDRNWLEGYTVETTKTNVVQKNVRVCGIEKNESRGGQSSSTVLVLA